MAWESIVAEEEALQLTPFQKKQANAKVKDWDGAVRDASGRPGSG
jgi:hypothetical protein